MSSIMKPGEATIHRAMDDEHNVLVAHGQFDPVYFAYLEHARRWTELPDPLYCTMMRQGLAAAALYLSCRPRDERVAWTLGLQEPAANIFLTGGASSNSVTGRVFTEGIRVAESNRLFVQSSRSRGEPVQSMVEVQGLDLLDIFEQYHRRSVQSPARFFDFDDGSFAMILGLPAADTEWMAGLDSPSALRAIRNGYAPLDTRSVEFRCGCDPERMVQVAQKLFGDSPEELFEGEDGLELSCPRCGHRWWLAREDF